MSIQDYIKDEMNKLDRGIVATPASREYLDSFSKANGGCNDFLLTQMAMNYAYKLALENLQDELT